jgi:hypothetical protein
MNMARIPLAVLLGLATTSSSANADDDVIAKNPFLRPYVADLKKDAPSKDLDYVRGLAEDDLVLLHHGYGTYIRNRWLWGGRDPALVKFFKDKGMRHPDGMSMVLIRALWFDLNAGLSAKERATLDAKRALVRKRLLSYQKAEGECEQVMSRAREKFDRCYASFGLPSKNPENREPFFELKIRKTGDVAEVVFFEGASEELKTCLRPLLSKKRFSPLPHDELITLYLTSFPNCRASDRDHLYDEEAAQQGVGPDDRSSSAPARGSTP